MQQQQIPEGMTKEQYAVRVLATTVGSDMVDNLEKYFDVATKDRVNARVDAVASYAALPQESVTEELMRIVWKRTQHTDFIIVWPADEQDLAILFVFKELEGVTRNEPYTPWIDGIRLASIRNPRALVCQKFGSHCVVTDVSTEDVYTINPWGVRGRIPGHATRVTPFEEACKEAKDVVTAKYDEVRAMFDAAHAEAMQKDFVSEVWAEEMSDRWEVVDFFPLIDGAPSNQSMIILAGDGAASIALPCNSHWVVARLLKLDARGQLSVLALWDVLQGSVMCRRTVMTQSTIPIESSQLSSRRAHSAWVVSTRSEDILTESKRIIIAANGSLIVRNPETLLDIDVVNDVRAEMNLVSFADYAEMVADAETVDADAQDLNA